MKVAETRLDRLSIDVLPDVHRRIKMFATLHSETIREYVLKCVKDRIKQESEDRELSALSFDLNKDPVLCELWENKKDAAYDKL